MKKQFIAICSVALFFTACKEVPPTINYSTLNYVDSTYVGATPATDAHNVLVEEFTGQSCSNCPAGHTELDNEAASNPGRVNVISLYENDKNNPLNNPPPGSVYDLRTDVALTLGLSSIYGGGINLPAAGVDRVPLAGTTTNLIGSGSWPTAINSRLTTTGSLNLNIASSYASGVATITALITYTQSVSSMQNLSIVVVEDSIVGLQEFPFGAIDSTYTFNDVFRGMVTAVPLGDPILDSLDTKAAGRVLHRVYTYTLPVVTPAINPSHCRVIAFVNATGAGSDYHVFQSAQTKLAP